MFHRLLNSRRRGPARLVIRRSKSPIGFATTGGATWPVWDRFITINGVKACHIGNVCGTCPFFFERLKTAEQSLGPSQLQAQLTDGLSELTRAHVKCLKSLLPDGKYSLSLRSSLPRLVTAGSEDDYFCNEQAALWSEIERPHDTGTKYYRCEDRGLSDGAMLFEFIVPMLPQSSLDADRVRDFVGRMRGGSTPTALAISVLDVKGPAWWDGDPEITTHCCLAHYLLDGHHKTFAASTIAHPVSLVSMLAMDQGVISSGDYDRLQLV